MTLNVTTGAGDLGDNRVIVLWADPDARNLGLQALAVGTGRCAAAAWNPAEVVHHAHDTPGTPLTKAMVLRDVGRKNGPITSMFRMSRVIVDTGGGDSFTDIYGMRRLLLMAYMHRAAHKAGTPIVLGPQTVGPFRSKPARRIARWVLQTASFVAARDSVSVDAAIELGGRIDIRATDLVFLLDRPDRTPTTKTALVNVSGLLWNTNPHVDHDAYRTQLRVLVRGLLDRGWQVGILAHVLDAPLADNDVPAVRQVCEEFPEVVAHIPESLDEVRSAMARVDLVVGSRMHACLNALSVGTPAVAWAYSRKFAPLLQDLSWSHVIDLRDASNAAAETLNLVDSRLGEMSESAGQVSEKGARIASGLVERLRRGVAVSPNRTYEVAT